MSPRAAALFALAFSLSLNSRPPVAGAAEPRLLADLDPRLGIAETIFPNASTFLPVGRRAVFVVAFTIPSGSGTDVTREIWGSDGTTSGTQRLSRLETSSNGSPFLGSTSRSAFFLDSPPDDLSGIQRLHLRATDGTVAGTRTLVTFATRPFSYYQPEALISGERLFLSGCVPAYGCEPWISDGTPAGTHRLREITPGPFGSQPHGFVELGTRVYFWANDPDGVGLWSSDGSRTGTRKVVTLPPFSNPGPLRVAASRLYFLRRGISAPVRSDLWTSDGSAAGTRPVAPFDRGTAGGPTAIQTIGAAGGGLVFVGSDRASGSRLWWTDGTARGTRRLGDQKVDWLASYTQSAFASLGGTVLFPGPQGELWASRGTRGTTGPLLACGKACPLFDFQTDPEDEPSFRPAGRRAYFREIRPDGRRPWVSDGTAAGTFALGDCATGCGYNLRFSDALAAGDTYFSDDAGRLWHSDGTPSGTRKVLDGGSDARLGPHTLVPIGEGRVLFAAAGPARGTEIWVSDGTPARTAAIARTSNGLGSDPVFVAPSAAVGGDEPGALFFACGEEGGALWSVASPDEAPRALLSQPFCHGDNEAVPTNVAAGGGRIFFSSILADHYTADLFASDGTPAGTRPLTRFENLAHVAQILDWGGRIAFTTLPTIDGQTEWSLWTLDPASGNPEPQLLLDQRIVPYGQVLVDDSLLYFLQRSAEQRVSLWRTDGTEAGTVALADVGFDNGTSQLRTRVRAGGFSYLLIDGSSGTLWRSDGTAAGTRALLPDPHVPSSLAAPQDLAVLDDSLYYFQRTEDFSGPYQLIRTDGRIAGTAVVHRFGGLDPFDYTAPRITVLGGLLYFVVDEVGIGKELWRSDGTEAGTRLVKDINPGAEGSGIEALFAAGGRLYFGADDGEHGVEPWSSDGTEAGTQPLGDLAPGFVSSAPRGFLASGGVLYFSADDGSLGREPWTLDLDTGALALHSATPRH